jgi:HEPN domain-containing protein
MSFEPRDYLRHILAEADYLIEQSAGLAFERFDADENLPRYPNGFESGAPGDFYTRREAEGAISDADAIIEFCRRAIS